MIQSESHNVYPWKASDRWLNLPELVQAEGQNERVLEEKLRSQIDHRIAQGDYSADNVAYVQKMTLALVNSRLTITDSRLEKLRTLCQLWDIDLREKEISSHRRFIGPFIVFFKRALFRILRVLLKDVLRQQRVFNATSISLLTDLANEAALESQTSVAPLDQA